MELNESTLRKFSDLYSALNDSISGDKAKAAIVSFVRKLERFPRDGTYGQAKVYKEIISKLPGLIRRWPDLQIDISNLVIEEVHPNSGFLVSIEKDGSLVFVESVSAGMPTPKTVYGFVEYLEDVCDGKYDHDTYIAVETIRVNATKTLRELVAQAPDQQLHLRAVLNILGANL